MIEASTIDQTQVQCEEEIELQSIITRYLEKKKAKHLPKGKASTKQLTGLKDTIEKKSEPSESSTAEVQHKTIVKYKSKGTMPKIYIKSVPKLYELGQTVDFDEVQYEANDDDFVFVSSNSNKLQKPRLLTISQLESFIDVFEKLTGYTENYMVYESLDNCVKVAES